MSIAAAALGAAGLAVAVTAWLATRRFRAMFDGEKAELLRRGRAAAPAPAAGPDVLAWLPPPVRRYLQVTGAAGRARPRVAMVRQRGGIRTAAGKPWMPFASEQIYAMEPPGFVWLADARVAPLVHLMARDAFVGGRGNMLIKLLGMITVADARGPEIDQGAGLRYWGEVLAFPEMVTSPYLRWEAIDEQHARVSIDQDGVTATAVVEFDPQGFPIATHADRQRDAGGRFVLTPWTGHSRDWRPIDGRLFPTRWESVWHLPEGDLAAVKMEILGVATE